LKIDLGRMFPGIVIFLIGAVLFVFWIVLAFLSFFLFFVPVLHGVFYFALDVLVASLVLMAVGGSLAFVGVSGWNHARVESKPWAYVELRTRKDRMEFWERGGEMFAIVAFALIFSFFYYNQVHGSQFFTSAFGFPEQVLFYAPLVLGALAAFARAVYGRRNAIRPFEAFNAAIFALSAFYLLAVFPFNFAYFAGMFPHLVRFTLTWVSAPIGQVVLFLAGIASIANLVYTSLLYVVVRAELVVERRRTAFQEMPT
jgi:hypothetical protein